MTSSNADGAAEKSLSALLDALIPADPAHGLPGGSVARFPAEPWIWESMKAIDESARDRHGKKLNELLPAERLALVEELKRTMRPFFTRLAKLLAETYYLRPEVNQALGIRVEPPFPGGFHVEEGDLALLEPVYLRGRIYRDV